MLLLETDVSTTAKLPQMTYFFVDKKACPTLKNQGPTGIAFGDPPLAGKKSLAQQKFV
jgi:hypothetical protein